jgi:hypothetical protein
MAVYQKETGTAHGRGFSGADSNGFLAKFLSWVKRPAADGSSQNFTADAPSNNITCAGHGYATGDSVKCTTTDTLPAGLSTGTEYFVIYGDPNTFQLATTYQNALDGTEIDITDAGTGTHSVYALGGGAGWYLRGNKSNPQSQTFTADHTTDTFTAAAHGYGTGDLVWVSNSGGALPAGLSASTNYYAIRTGADTFQLATSYQNAIAGSVVAISGNGTGTHSVVMVEKYIVVCDTSSPTVNDYDTGPTSGPPKYIKIGMLNSEAGYIRVQFLLWWNTTTNAGWGYFAGYRVATADDADFMYDFRGGAETMIIQSVIGTAIDTTGTTEFIGDANFLEGTDKIGNVQSGVSAGSSVVLQLDTGEAANFTVGNYYFLYDFDSHAWVNCVKITDRNTGTDEITVDSINHDFPAGSVIGAYPHRLVAFGDSAYPPTCGDNFCYPSFDKGSVTPKVPYCNYSLNANVHHIGYGGIYGSAMIAYAATYLDRMAPNRKGNWCVMNPGIAEYKEENSYHSAGGTGVSEGYGTLKNVILTKVGTMAAVLNGRTDGGKQYKYFQLSSTLFAGGSSLYAVCFLDTTSTS